MQASLVYGLIWNRCSVDTVGRLSDLNEHRERK
jgi:hypothetical protein